MAINLAELPTAWMTKKIEIEQWWLTDLLFQVDACSCWAVVPDSLFRCMVLSKVGQADDCSAFLVYIFLDL